MPSWTCFSPRVCVVCDSRGSCHPTMASCCDFREQKSRYLQLLDFQKLVTEMCRLKILFTVVEVASLRGGWVESAGWVSVKPAFLHLCQQKIPTMSYDECFCSYQSLIFCQLGANYSFCVTRAKPQELIDKWCQDLHRVEKSMELSIGDASRQPDQETPAEQ